MGLETAAQAPLQADQGMRNEQRPERGGRSPRGERRPRGPRTDNDLRPAESTDTSTQANADQPDPERQDLAVDGSQAQGESAERNDAAPREKRSRDRYGRDRKPRGDRTDRPNTDNAESTDAQATLPLDAQPESPEDSAPRKSYFSVPAASADTGLALTAPAEPTSVAPLTAPVNEVVATPPAAAPVAVTPMPAAVAPAQAVATIVAPPAPPKATPQAAAPAAASLPKVQPYSLPLEDLSQLAQQSGLSWVLSDASKVAATQAAMAAEPQPVRVPRERPASVSIDERPLVLVETKRDLRNMTLPFEATEAQ